jgi:hypothetical protein
MHEVQMSATHRFQHRTVILTSFWRADAIVRALAVGRARRYDRAVELIQITVPKTAVKGCDLACRARPSASCASSAATFEVFEGGFG